MQEQKRQRSIQLLKEKREEGLHGVFKRLRRNGHQLKKEAANSSTLTVTHRRLNPQNSLCMRGGTVGMQA
jgi:hypothetical protein